MNEDIEYDEITNLARLNYGTPTEGVCLAGLIGIFQGPCHRNWSVTTKSLPGHICLLNHD